MGHAVLIFDTLQYAKRLKQAGVTEEQAEAHAEALKDLVDDKLATKQDVVHLERKITEMGYKLTIRLVGMLIAGIAVLGAFLGLIKFLA